MDARKVLLAKREKFILSPECALSTGSTLLNLACTDHPDFGYRKGGYYYLVGDSASGKTWLSMSCFAEAARNKHFKDYRFIFDDVEGGALMDVENYFGKEVMRRLEPPRKNKRGEPVYSTTIESFYDNLFAILESEEPFIYWLDSQDALGSETAQKKIGKQRAAREEGEEAKGAYTDGKAKYHAQNMREALSALRKVEGILGVIGQVKDNPSGWGFEKKVTSGGKSLRFYANLEIWTRVKNKIIRRVRGKDRTIGNRCFAQVHKNRITGKIGKDREAEIPIYHSYGIDDVGSCVDYLIAEKHWRKFKGEERIYNAKDLMFEGSRGEIIAHVEEHGLEARLRSVTARLWREIEDECKPDRKRRYE